MRDVCDMYGISVDRAGFARCCFHDDSTASMKIYNGRRGYHCFGCHSGGDVLDFTQKYFGLDFPAALRKLNDDFRLGLSLDGQTDRDALKQARIYAQKRRKAMEQRKNTRYNLQMAYDKALSRFTALDALAEQARSQALLAAQNGVADNWDKGVTTDMAYAVANVEAAWYELCEADFLLRAFDNGGEWFSGPSDLVKGVTVKQT